MTTTLLLYALPPLILLPLTYYALPLLSSTPLNKIPGPFLAKITSLPYLYSGILGIQIQRTSLLLKKYGRVVRVSPGVVVVCGKEEIGIVLVGKDLRKSEDYEGLCSEKGVASLFSETNKRIHRNTRRLLSVGFGIKYLNGLEEGWRECVDECAEYLEGVCKKAGDERAIVDASLMMGNLSFDIQASSSLGGSFHLVKTNDTKVKALFMNKLQIIALHSFFPFLRWVPGMNGSGKQLGDMITGILENRRKEISEGEVKKDLLQVLIEANLEDPKAFTEKHIREEMLLLMIAGSDTSASTATFTLLLLLQNPEKLKKLTEELEEALPHRDDKVTFSKTQELPYLNAVINECMRVFPVAAVGSVRCAEETITLGGYEIPAGTDIIAMPAVLGKDPSIWPDAEEFIPERWLGEYKGASIDKKAFLPFSAGSRNCIGQQFALKEIRMIIATIIRRFEISVVEGQDLELRYHIVPHFKDGTYNVGFKVRD